jgi:hypothetical protein
VPRDERRKKTRIQLTRGLLARYGTMGAIILDITDSGARIEHFNRLELRKSALFRFEWQKIPLEVTAQVMSCRIHRFAVDEGGTTVYQSGLMFTDFPGDSASRLRELVSTIVARSLAEQVANARGIGPIIESESQMPVFRAGVVEAKGLEANQKGADRYIPTTEVVVDRGYLRCSLIGTKWEKKWTRSPEQPEQGFTIPASEPPDLVEQLCVSYLSGDEEQRKLIVALAQISTEKS